MIKTYLAVMTGGALGVAARMWLSGFFATRFGETFPLGTLVVNVTGCLVIGLFTGLTGPESPYFVSPLTRQVVTIGILGGFTTFSSFGLQTINLMNDGEWFYAGLNILLSVIVCLAAVWCGIILSSLITSK